MKASTGVGRRGIGGELRIALLAGSAGLSGLMFASAAWAQDATPAAQEAAGNAEPGGILTTEGEPARNGQEIIVTGSRIARKDYQSTSPIVTVGEELLQQSSTAAIEQNLNKLPQFTPANGKTPSTAGTDVQPTATNTPGAATISLRGLGANRNLVLLDGRRMTPSNAAGIVDINTIPSAAIERVEIISGGASSTYGADAVAGVTNFILKKNFKGFDIDAQTGLSEHGDGFEYQLAGIMGADFSDGRGNVSIAMSMNTREASYQRDRSWYQKLWRDPTTAPNRNFSLYPGVALGANGVAPANESIFYNQLFPGTTKAFDAAGQPLANTISNSSFAPGASNFSVYVNPTDKHLFTITRNTQGGIKFFDGTTYMGDVVTRTAVGAISFVDANQYLVLPLTRYNTFLRGSYELTDWLSVFGQGLYSHTKTKTTIQGGAITSGWDVFVPYGTGVYTGSAIPDTAYGGVGNPSSVILNGMTFNNAAYVDNTPGNLADNPTNPAFTKAYGSQFACANSATGGCTNNQVIGQFLPADLQKLLNIRTNPNGRVELQYGFPMNRSVTNEVSTYNLLAGLQGKVPGSDWTFEAFVNHGATDTFTRQTGVFSLTRLRTLLTAPNFGTGFVSNSNVASGRPAFGANFGSCTSGMNIFVTPWDQVSEDCKKAITGELKNRSKVTQSIVEANAQGTLFALPAGDLKAAIGASYRRLKFEFINDTLTNQGESFLDQAIGIYPSSDSFGGYNTKEAYGELLVPVIKDVPLVKSLDLELGGRVSDYNTTGKSYTYKALADWAVTDWLRVRGGYNRAERSPNVAELYLASSQVFGYNSLGDLCSERSSYRISANPAYSKIAADVKATCRAVMDRSGGAGTAAQYYDQRLVSAQPAPAGAFAWTNAKGNPNLKPEKADTLTAGIVVQSPFRSSLLSRLRFTADWYQIKIKDAIGLQGAGTALQQCLDPTYNTQVAGASGSAAAATAAANNPYCSGIRYDPLPALGTANFDVTYYNNGQVDISGLDGQIDWSAQVGPGRLSFNGLINYYLHYRSRELAVNPLVDYSGTLGTSQNALNAGAYRYRTLATIGYGIGPARISLQWQHLPKVKVESAAVAPTTTVGYPSYNLFNLNGTLEITREVGLRAGVDNLFNKAPPLGNINTAANISLGQNPGGSYNAAFYDVIGRRFFLGINAKF